MSDTMRPVPFQELIERIFTEYRNHNSIFGIDKSNFYRKGSKTADIFGVQCSTVLGPAAGPHTQLAQNIISSYLVGGRFIELKTVQIMDYLGEKKMISKPCIDARDEGHNVEWSSEFTLEKSFDEYLKAWFALHVIQAMFDGKFDKPDFVFNMSVGYNLEGIKQPKMQQFINGLIDARTSCLFEQYKQELSVLIDEQMFYAGSDLERNCRVLDELVGKISPNVCSSVTISTMHGCPPHEIESICKYMLEDKNLNTFVKLNPTLLGYDEVRKILDTTGFNNISLKKESFEYDLQINDAMEMIKRLVSFANVKKLIFGVKLTNTLANINTENVFDGEERYMSGRALFPVSTSVAALIAKEFDGKLPISYSGGANAFTVRELFDCGIKPITVATDMLKPGGYARLKQMAQLLDKEKCGWNQKSVDVNKIEKLSQSYKDSDFLQKAFRGGISAKVSDSLPVFNCFISPCKQACPIHQDIPEYITLVGEERYAEALELIYSENALPNITCNICDHQCQKHCARTDYEGPIAIRQMKKIAVENGRDEFLSKHNAPLDYTSVRAAVVGAGPSGLATAYYLARAGFDTTVFEKCNNAGGVVANIIPAFRISPKAVQADIDYIASMGVKFKFGTSNSEVSVSELKKKGFEYLFYAIGTEDDVSLNIDCDEGSVIGSLDFLKEYNKQNLFGKTNIVVCGGGNTAIDCARAARRIAGVKNVSVVYRRTLQEMPADYEEYVSAADEGIGFFFLSNPGSLRDNKLMCHIMKQGEPDESGRRIPVETPETFVLDCDLLITALGEKVSLKNISELGLPLNDKNRLIVKEETKETCIENVFAVGDMVSGPSTVVKCMASAKKAVGEAIRKVLASVDCDENTDTEDDDDSFVAEDDFYNEIIEKKSRVLINKKTTCTDMCKFAEQESNRCMMCSYLCTKCVDVCPNRANVAVDMRFSANSADAFQILHIDSFCNECGNCATFCNHNGRPYKDKFTLFNLREDYENSTNSGFFVEGDTVLVRINGKTEQCRIDRSGHLNGNVPDIVKDMIEQVFLSYSYLLGRVDA